MIVRDMLGVGLATILCIGCASSADEERTAPDVAGTWAAPALQNVDPGHAGLDEVPDGVIVVFKEGEVDDPDAEPMFQTFRGGASVTLALFYQVGTESDGFTALLKLGGSAKFSGTWESDYDTDAERYFNFSLPCEQVTRLDDHAPALACGDNGVSSRLDADCSKADGNPTVSCYIADAGGNFTLRRKQ